MHTFTTAPASPLPILGFTVWWSLAGIRVPHNDLAAALDAHGFSTFLPPRPSHHIALRRALTALLRGNSGITGSEDDDGESSRAFLRTIPERGQRQLVFAVIHEAVDFRALGLEHQTSLRLRLDKKNGFVTVTSQERGDIYVPPTVDASAAGDGIIAVDDGAVPFAAALRPYWQKYRDLHIAADLSRMMRDIVCGDSVPRTPRRTAARQAGPKIGLNAVSVRPNGGLYFVPGDTHGTLERLEQLIGDLPTDRVYSPFFIAQALIDEAKAKGQMARAVHQGFLGELQALSTDLERIAGTDRNNPSTLANRLSAYRQVKEKAQMYSDLLGMQQSDVVAALGALRHKIAALLDDDPSESDQTLFCPAA